MAISPSSSAQRARLELAARLREIRLDAGLTARALSVRAGWHEAKTIESGKQPLTDACSATRSATPTPWRGNSATSSTPWPCRRVSLGIIPLAAARRPMWTLEAFTVFDDARVHIELLSAQVTATAPTEVVLYLHAYGKLAEMAAYGPQARSSKNACLDCVH